MCYNKSTIDKLRQIQLQFEFAKILQDEGDAFIELPQYNALRLQKLPVIAYRDGKLQAFKALWWLVPGWSKTGKPEVTAFNARIETIMTSRLFAPYFRSRRCLIPVRAFFEYKPDEMVTITLNGKTKPVKQPYCIRMKDGGTFMLAGIYSVWVDKKTGEEMPSYAVITTVPNELLKPIHDRMPVILDEKHFKQWLDPEFEDVKALKALAEKPYPASKMKAQKVSAEYLYDRRHNDEDCWAPATQSSNLT